MPVDIKRYPENWTDISNYVRFVRAEGRCECTGECGKHTDRCNATHGEPHPITNSKVVLTTAHLGTDTDDKHDKMDVRPDNLKAMCQRCHLIFDLPEHMHNANVTRHKKRKAEAKNAGQIELF